MSSRSHCFTRLLSFCMLGFILFFAIFSNNNPLLTSNQNIDRVTPPSIIVAPHYAANHPPIFINGDAALDAFCGGNGTNGLSWSTAYQIENYSIDCGSSGTGITIQHTTRYLYLINLTVINSGPFTGDSGMSLLNCTNIVLQACNISYNLRGLNMTDSSMCWINASLFSFNGDHGIWLDNCTNTIIENNNASSNSAQGIYLYRSVDNILENNTIEFNGNNGICFDSSTNNILQNNHAYNDTQAGYLIGTYSSNNLFINNTADRDIVYGFIFLSDSQYNHIFNNTITNTQFGISMWAKNNNLTQNNIQFTSIAGIKVTSVIYPAFSNLIYNNSISNVTGDGILVTDPNSYNTSVQENRIYNASANGIHLYGVVNSNLFGNLVTDCYTGISVQDANDSVIENNTVNQNSLGIGVTSNANNNLIYRNNMLNSLILQASDDGINTQWDNGSAGNFWSDYVGTDPDDDFAGEAPYVISGTSAAQDHYPFCDDGDDLPPAIFSTGLPAVWGAKTPSFELNIVEAYILDQIWYSYDYGLTNHTCTQAGLLSNWSTFFDGKVLITFWANDSVGHVGEGNFIVEKDTTPPIINVQTPITDNTYANPPEFIISITESHLDQVWYEIKGNPTQYHFTGSTGTINANLWASLPAGKVSIIFHANDTAGNEMMMTLTVYKGAAVDQGWIWPTTLVAAIAVAIMIGYYIIMNRRKKDSGPQEGEEDLSWE